MLFVAVVLAAILLAPAVRASLRPEAPLPVAAQPDPPREQGERSPPPQPADDPVAEDTLPQLGGPISFDAEGPLQVGRIVIPTLGLDAVFGEGVHDAVLERGPGHWPDTPLPGQPGNSVLSGHRTTWTHPFGDLDRLVAGDVITTGVGPDPGVEFRVTEVRVVPEAEYVGVVLAQPADPAARTLTLFACHPKGSRTHRIVVTAVA